MRRARGFTLLEVMIVVAVIGILAAMSVNTFEALNARTAPRTAAADISSYITLARNRALERGSDVWLIVYPEQDTNGALFVYEDVDTNFRSATQLPGGSLIWNDFNPPNGVFPLAGERSKLLERVYFRTYARENVQFVADAGVAWGAPFTSLNANGSPKCTFCTQGGPGNRLRGAMVFTGEGSVYFVNGSGALVGDRFAGFSIGGRINTGQGTRFAVAGATGYGGFFQE